MVESSARRSSFIQEAIRKAHEVADADRQKRTVTDFYEGDKIETEYFKESNGSIWSKILINGKETSRSRVYCVNTDKPYTRDFSRKWYITENHLAAMKNAM